MEIYIQQWPEFWGIFKSSIHEQNLTKMSKFSYLKGAVKGAAAAEAISGISVNNDNYDMVVALLQEKFGRKEAIIQSLYSKFTNSAKSLLICNTSAI